MRTPHAASLHVAAVGVEKARHVVIATGAITAGAAAHLGALWLIHFAASIRAETDGPMGSGPPFK